MVWDVACEEPLLCLSRGLTVRWTQSLKPRGAARAAPADQGLSVEGRGSQAGACALCRQLCWRWAAAEPCTPGVSGSWRQAGKSTSEAGLGQKCSRVLIRGTQGQQGRDSWGREEGHPPMLWDDPAQDREGVCETREFSRS